MNPVTDTPIPENHQSRSDKLHGQPTIPYGAQQMASFFRIFSSIPISSGSNYSYCASSIGCGSPMTPFLAMLRGIYTKKLCSNNYPSQCSACHRCKYPNDKLQSCWRRHTAIHYSLPLLYPPLKPTVKVLYPPLKPTVNARFLRITRWWHVTTCCFISWEPVMFFRSTSHF